MWIPQHVEHLWVPDVMVLTVLVATTLDQHVSMDTADVHTTHKGTTVPALVSLVILNRRVHNIINIIIMNIDHV